MAPAIAPFVLRSPLSWGVGTGVPLPGLGKALRAKAFIPVQTHGPDDGAASTRTKSLSPVSCPLLIQYSIITPPKHEAQPVCTFRKLLASNLSKSNLILRLDVERVEEFDLKTTLVLV